MNVTMDTSHTLMTASANFKGGGCNNDDLEYDSGTTYQTNHTLSDGDTRISGKLKLSVDLPVNDGDDLYEVDSSGVVKSMFECTGPDVKVMVESVKVEPLTGCTSTPSVHTLLNTQDDVPSDVMYQRVERVGTLSTLGKPCRKHVRRGRHKQNGLPTKISRAAIRRLARRGGIKRISHLVTETARSALDNYIRGILGCAIEYTTYSRRKTVTVSDIKLGLKRNGYTLYGHGA